MWRITAASCRICVVVPWQCCTVVAAHEGLTRAHTLIRADLAVILREMTAQRKRDRKRDIRHQKQMAGELILHAAAALVR